MTTRGKAAFLWGVTGALVFMIGHQGYLLFGGDAGTLTFEIEVTFPELPL